MKRNLLKIVAIIIFIMVSFVGCAKIKICGPKKELLDMSAQNELNAAKGVIEKAQNEGKDKRCPDAFKDVMAQWEKAVNLANAQKINEAVDEAGAAREKAMMLCPDSDEDGVSDEMDKCPDTPKNAKVDKEGCPVDTDGDGVPDFKDMCLDTPAGVKVDDRGCPRDSDADGVPDYRDKCPRTSKNQKVNEQGCWVCESLLNFNLKSAVNFDFDKFIVKTDYYTQLAKVVECLKLQSSINIEIIGHTCSIGPKEYNQLLSEKRAHAVMRYFVENGVSQERLLTKGFGVTRPIASNETSEGRRKNRRVELNLLFK